MISGATILVTAALILALAACTAAFAQNVMTNRDVAGIWKYLGTNRSLWSTRWWALEKRVAGHDESVRHLTAASLSQAKVNEIWLRHLSDHTFALVAAPRKRAVKRVSVKAPNVVRRKRRVK